MNLETVIDNHIRAIGGYQSVEGLQSIQIHFHLIEPSFTVDGIYSADRKGRMRVDIFADKVRVFSEGFDGRSGWQLHKDATKGTPTSPAGTIALQHGIENHLFGLHEYASRGHLLELDGHQVLNGSEYHVIKVVYKEGGTQWRYVNAATWLIERVRERKALHPDVDPTQTTIETRLSDFRKVGKILRSFHEEQVDLSTGLAIQTTITRQVKINPDFENDFFECP